MLFYLSYAKSFTKPSVTPTVIRPLHSFENALFPVMDVTWHPRKPSVFAAANGGGFIELWDINADMEVTVFMFPD